MSLRPHSAPGHYITLFLGCVREGAEAFSVSPSVVLAYVIAHEIGHLLLPIGHSSAGIMRARPDQLDWKRAARGALEFHPGDRERMRAALQHRLAAPWAVGVKR